MGMEDADEKVAYPRIGFEKFEAFMEMSEGYRFRLNPSSVKRSRLLTSMLESTQDETRASIPVPAVAILQWLKHVQPEVVPAQASPQMRAQARSLLHEFWILEQPGLVEAAVAYGSPRLTGKLSIYRFTSRLSCAGQKQIQSDEISRSCHFNLQFRHIVQPTSRNTILTCT